jgi:hypothetical protein
MLKRAKLWRNKVEDLIKSVVVASTEYKNGYQQKLKEELEFAKANIELLSEDDYKWILEQKKSPAVESKKSKKSLSIDSLEFKEALANAPFVCKTHDNSDTEVMDKFKKAATKFTDTTKALTDVISKPKLGNAMSSESRSTRWLVQIIKGKDTYYRTLRTANRMSPSILDAKCYVSENAAKQAANSVAIENRLLTLSTVNSGNIAESCVVEVKEVLCTESSSRTIELVKPVVEAIEIPDDEKFVLWSNGSNEFFVQIDSTGIRTTKNLDEATKFLSYKSASQAVKKTDEEFPYRFSISAVKNVKSLVLPVEKPVTKAQVRARKPKVKEEWVLYTSGLTTPFQYYHLPSPGLWDTTTKLGNAKKFSSYSAASKVRHKLIQDGFPGFEVGESKDFEDCK